MAEGCRQAGCALLGGEMAEHPDAMEPGDVDLAGFAVGVVERDARARRRARIAPGDVLVALPSPGLRSQRLLAWPAGCSVDRAGRRLDEPGVGRRRRAPLADELLRPSVIYAPAVLAAAAPR